MPQLQPGLCSVKLQFSCRKTTADPVLFQRLVCARDPVRKSVCMRESAGGCV